MFVFLFLCILIVCLCVVITRSYLSSLIKQLLIKMFVYLFPKLSLDIRFRMMDAKLGLAISSVLNC